MTISDPASQQLSDSLHNALTQSLSTRRPILHHLNADSSWLLQVPGPRDGTEQGGRMYFNVIIDPWLKGPQSDVARWFSQQFHATESAVGSIKEVEDLIWDTERLAGGSDREKEEGSCIDAVAISHEFTDHCHRETLEEVERSVPVFATTKAANLIRSWGHFDTVLDIPLFHGTNFDWRTTSLSPLPDYVGISRLRSETDALYYHSALLIAFDTEMSSSLAKRHNLRDSSKDQEYTPECLIYTPHGVKAEVLEPVTLASPPIRTLAFLHGLHDVSISWGQQLNLGAHNALQVQRLLKARYWVGTHDEVKKGGGLVSWFLQRKVITVEEALQGEEKKAEDEGEGGVGLGAVRFEEVGNGESRILE